MGSISHGRTGGGEANILGCDSQISQRLSKPQEETPMNKLIKSNLTTKVFNDRYTP